MRQYILAEKEREFLFNNLISYPLFGIKKNQNLFLSSSLFKK